MELKQLQDLTKELNSSESITFLYVLNQVIDHKCLTKSNKIIAKELKKSISTIEKHLNKLDKLGLIIRESIKAHNNLIMRWETVSRSITIPSNIIDPKILASMRTQRINSMLELIITPEATKKYVQSYKESRSS